MPIYFILLDGRSFHEELIPPLAASWRQRSFAPCRALCASLLPTVEEFRGQFFAGSEEPLLAQVERGLPYDRRVWRTLVGEVLLFAAREVPELQTAPETLCCLLAPERYGEEGEREHFAPIQQAHFGSRDLEIGPAVYRPEQVGLNDRDDSARLAAYLASVEPERWSVADLAGLRDMEDDEERAEELEFVRDWFPALREVYRWAAERRHVVVCERF
jgi:hypothetical protein